MIDAVGVGDANCDCVGVVGVDCVGVDCVGVSEFVPSDTSSFGVVSITTSTTFFCAVFLARSCSSLVAGRTEEDS